MLVLEEINLLFERLLEDSRFFLIKKEIERKGCFSYFLINQEGRLLYSQFYDVEYCRLIKSIDYVKGRCDKIWLEGFNKSKEINDIVVFPCHGKRLVFSIPIKHEGEFVGCFCGCQMQDPTVDYNKLKFDRFEFLQEEKIIKEEKLLVYERLKQQLEGVVSLCQMLFDYQFLQLKLFEREVEIKGLRRFIEFSKKIPFGEEEGQGLFDKIVDFVSNITNSQIVSLFLYDGKYLCLKSALGLPKELIGKVKVELGSGIVGWVAKYKEPLMVKDITCDKRFDVTLKPRYFTKSLLSCPIIKNNKLIGVINVNNERTKRIYNQGDCNVLEVICEYIGGIL